MTVFKQALEDIFKRADSLVSGKAPLVQKSGKKGRSFNIHKRSLPPGIDRIVFYNLPSKKIAEKIIETAADSNGNLIYGLKLYLDDVREMKTYIFYEAVPSDATPREKNIYYNSSELTKEEGSDTLLEEVEDNDQYGQEWIG